MSSDNDSAPDQTSSKRKKESKVGTAYQQCYEDGRVFKVYKARNEAAKATGCDPSSISQSGSSQSTKKPTFTVDRDGNRWTWKRVPIVDVVDEKWKDVVEPKECKLGQRISDMGRLVSRLGVNISGDSSTATKVVTFAYKDAKRDGVVRKTMAEMVALHFVPNPDPETHKYVRHINNDVSDNRATNLRWATSPMARKKTSVVSKSAMAVTRIAKDGSRLHYRSLAEAAASTGHKKVDKISLVIGQGDTKTSVYGYRWQKAPSDAKFEEVDSAQATKDGIKRRAVEQVDAKTGKVVASFKSLTAAADAMVAEGHTGDGGGATKSAVWAALKASLVDKTARYGFLWRQLEPKATDKKTTFKRKKPQSSSEEDCADSDDESSERAQNPGKASCKRQRCE